MRYAIVVVLLVLGGRASANMGRPTWGGSLTGEPSGLRDIAIQHEALVIDMRPVAASERARISATYQLDNRGAAATLALVFAAGERGIVGFVVTLDGAAAGAHAVDGPLPPAWQAPPTTPRPGGGSASYDLSERDSAVLGFTLTIPPGVHALAVAYEAEALHHHDGGPTVLHQLAYVLAPARSWASFGGLEVSVQVPPGWDAAITPAMARTGDALHGAFGQLPADAIALSVQAPAPWFVPLQIALGLVALAVLAGGGFVVAAWSRRRSRPDAVYPSLTRAAGMGFVWAAGFGAAGWLAIVAPAWTLPAGEADALRGYAVLAYGALVVLGALALWLIGAVVAWWADRRIVLAARAAAIAPLDTSS
ncbi:MAG TPA: hypothetical protein VGC42_06950 [Kofleriaceae bacterium]